MTYSDEVLADSPLAWWRLDEWLGTAMADSSGNSRTLTLSSATGVGATSLLVGDPVNRCWDAPGNTHGQIADAAWMDQATFTAEAWIRFDSASGYRGVISRDAQSARGWNLYLRDSKITYYQFAPSAIDVSGTTIMSSSNAYHLALTYDGTTMRLYVNGVEELSQAATITTTLANHLTIGGSYAGTASPTLRFDGRIDEVAYYGTALSSTRLLAHYTAGSTAVPTVVDVRPAPTVLAITDYVATSVAYGVATTLYTPPPPNLITNYSVGGTVTGGASRPTVGQLWPRGAGQS